MVFVMGKKEGKGSFYVAVDFCLEKLFSRSYWAVGAVKMVIVHRAVFAEVTEAFVTSEMSAVFMVQTQISADSMALFGSHTG